MFSFFKKKKPPEVEIVAEVVATPQAEPEIVPPAAVPAPAVLADEVVAAAVPAVAVPLAIPAPEPVATHAEPRAESAGETRVDAFIPPSDLAQPQERPKLSWTERLKMGLAKTRDKLGKSLASVFGGGQIDDELYEELETVLLTADMGVDATQHLLKDVRERVSLKGLKDSG